MVEGIDLIAYLAAVTLLTMAPGLDTVLIIRNTSRGGVSAGILSSVGICSGLFFHALLSAAGISVILMSSAVLYSVLKMIGAAYLCYLGIKSIRSAWRGEALSVASVSGTDESSLSSWMMFREGLLSNVLNPKTIAFYMAFLPQFIDPANNAVMQALGLAGIHFVIAMIWQSGLALLVDKAKQMMQSPQVTRWIDGILGALLITFAAKLAMTER